MTSFVAEADTLTEAQKEVLVSLRHDLMRVCLVRTCSEVVLRSSLNQQWFANVEKAAVVENGRYLFCHHRLS